MICFFYKNKQIKCKDLIPNRRSPYRDVRPTRLTEKGITEFHRV